MFTSRRGRRFAAALVAMTVVLTGCASSTDQADPAVADTGPGQTDTAADEQADDTADGGVDSSDPADQVGEEPDTGAATTTDTDTGATSFPVTITAANGEVTIDEQPMAIISLSPTITEILYAVGAGEQVLAVDPHSNYPADLPDQRIDGFDVSVEAIAALEPDLVITNFITDAQLDQFAAVGITVILQHAAVTVADTVDQIRQLAVATGHADRGETVATAVTDAIDAHRAATDPDATALTYFYELDDTYYTVTSDTFVGHLLGILGLRSIADGAEGAAESGGYPQLSPEYILDADPDYIFLLDTGFGTTVESVAQRPGWDGLDAVTGDRVVALDADIASRWGPRITDLLDDVAAILRAHPVG